MLLKPWGSPAGCIACAVARQLAVLRKGWLHVPPKNNDLLVGGGIYCLNFDAHLATGSYSAVARQVAALHEKW